MAKVQVTVCDECRSQTKPTKRYRLSEDGRNAVLDLCVDDAKPIERLLEKHQGSGTRRKVFDASVKTIEEIEAEKAKKKA